MNQRILNENDAAYRKTNQKALADYQRDSFVCSAYSITMYCPSIFQVKKYH